MEFFLSVRERYIFKIGQSNIVLYKHRITKERNERTTQVIQHDKRKRER